MKSKLIGYARVSTKHQDTERQVADLLAAGVRPDDLYVDHGAGGAMAIRPEFTRAILALQPGDHLVVSTLDRLGRSTVNMVSLIEDLRQRGVALRVLSLGGQHVDTSTPTGSMLFTVMAALAQMELDIKKERINDSVSKRRAAGRDLGGRSQRFTESQIRSAKHLIEAGQPAAQVARDSLGSGEPSPPSSPGRYVSASSARIPSPRPTFREARARTSSMRSTRSA
ncbi:recombinase family protein [Cryobacterium sp. TMT4-31]|nr:recombinase family protein [Cryobacterium sp. TMT4-31]